jgi:hypothetical protein
MKNLLLALLLFPVTFYAQVAMNGSGSYSQNFDALLSTGSVNDWFENSTIPSWYSQRTTSSTLYSASTGSSNFGGLYSYGASGSSERSLGSIGSGNLSFGGDFAHGILLQNNGTDLVTNLNLTYTLEQWRNGGSNTAQTVTVWYKVSATRDTLLNPGSINTDWTDVTALDGSSPVSSLITGAPLDGNAAANKLTINGIIPVTIASGSFIMIKWSDVDHPGDDDGLSIDDVSISWESCTPTTGTDILTACDSLTWIDGNTYTFSSSSTTYNLVNAAGCDSIVTLDLTLNYSGSSYFTQEVCTFPYTSNGTTYNSAGVYTTISVGTNGCPVIDSVEVVQISPIAVFANETAMESGIIETAIIGQNYQWVDCGTLGNISGQTTNTYAPQSNGSYAVIVEFPGNCSSTSNCVLIDYLSIEESTAEHLQVYPNPSNGTIQITIPSNTSTQIVLSDMNGKVIYTKKLLGGINTVTLPNLDRGAYFMTVKTNDTVQQQKIIIE